MHHPDPVARPLDHLPLMGRPADIALKAGGVIFSYAALEDAVGRYASVLRAMGMPLGARIVSWLPKTAVACLLPLAAARAGFVYVPANPALKPGQLEHILEDCDASLLVSSVARLGLLPADMGPAGCQRVSESGLMDMADVALGLPPSNHNPADLCQLLYTSGSTGKPKGVMLSHSNLWIGSVCVCHYLHLTPEDRTLAVLPLSFDYGQNQMFSAWQSGGTVVPLDYLGPRDVIEAVQRDAITVLAGVPPLWHQLLSSKWPSGSAAPVRCVTNSGGALTELLVHKMRETFSRADIVPMYGLTEAFRGTFVPPQLADCFPLAIGGAVPFAEIMVVREDGTAAGPGEEGELVQAGPLVTQGYWNQPEATEARFRPAPSFSRRGGVAIWSGDRVKIGPLGLLFYRGRDDELIKSSGHRISPTEVEEVALMHPAVEAAFACGVLDARLGQAICLVVTGDGRQEPGLIQHLKSVLPSYMRPHQILWRDDMPLTPNGKVDRQALRRETEQNDR